MESSSTITQYFYAVFQQLGIPTTVLTFLIVFLAITILKNILIAFSMYIIVRTQFAVMKSLIDETYTLCFNARWHFFSSGNQGTLLNTFNREIMNVGVVFATMGSLLAAFFQAIFYLAIPFVICWQATVISIISLAVLSLPLLYLAKIGYHLGEQSTQTGNRYMEVLQETFSAAKLILGFGNQHKHISEVNKKFYRHRTAVVRAQTLAAGVHALYEPIFVGVLLFILYLTFYRYKVPVAETLVMYYAFHSLMPMFSQINSRYHLILNNLPSYEQVMQIQTLAKQEAQPTGTHPFVELHEAIIFQNVQFVYPGNPPVLNDINVTIPRGKMIAFVGGSGAGKTTLLDLIMGFYQPGKGIITLDGIPLLDYDIQSFRQRIGFVPQDTILFNTSIRENLLWSCHGSTQQELDKACQLANAYDFIMELPRKYKTVIGDRGVRLSGGQRQRLALARAILRKPELLFLDEATSALDSESERLIQDAIEKISKKTTVVIIAHRLSTITRADYIYVLDKGTIVEEGSFDDLVEKNSVFNRMVELQKL
jgi:ATP-binding cassette subfamily B protein